MINRILVDVEIEVTEAMFITSVNPQTGDPEYQTLRVISDIRPVYRSAWTLPVVLVSGLVGAFLACALLLCLSAIVDG